MSACRQLANHTAPVAPSDIRSSYALHPTATPLAGDGVGALGGGRCPDVRSSGAQSSARSRRAPARIQLDGNRRDFTKSVRLSGTRRSGGGDHHFDAPARRAEQPVPRHHDARAPRQHGAQGRPARRIRPPGSAEERAGPSGRAQRSRTADPEEGSGSARGARERRQRDDAGRERHGPRAARDV